MSNRVQVSDSSSMSNSSAVTLNKVLEPVGYGIEFRQPTRGPVDIQFSNVTYTANVGFIIPEKKEILHQINGRFLPRQLIAIMGPSGAGKSTLLDILSGFRINGVKGAVYTNGRGRNLDVFRKMSCYITQDDRLQGCLTVHENMYFAARLKLDPGTQKYERDSLIEEILTALGLYESLNTKAARLSGGQKKRLSIALELISNPLIMFLDEPTTGLDSSSCYQVVNLLKTLARQNRTIICTIHQPSASLFQMFDQVYVLAEGQCLYQGATGNLLSYFQHLQLPCPKYHNPADYVIELACGEHGKDKITRMVKQMDNGKCLDWFNTDNNAPLPDLKALRALHPLTKDDEAKSARVEDISEWLQLKVLIKRGFLKSKRDAMLIQMKMLVNIVTGIMLGALFWQSGYDGSRVRDNYNLLFSILMHHMMSPMMLMILTFPQEMPLLLKEHFNRWYSLRSYYISITIVDIPSSFIGCLTFSIMIYFFSAQPLDIVRFLMFFTIGMLTVFVAQSVGLMIGAVFDVVNGTFLGPTISVPMMMLAGFGVRLIDLPTMLWYMSYISYLRYGLEGLAHAIYGMNRPTLPCDSEENFYCHYKYPSKFLSDVSMRADMFYWDVFALCATIFILRTLAYILLKWKVVASR